MPYLPANHRPARRSVTWRRTVANEARMHLLAYRHAVDDQGDGLTGYQQGARLLAVAELVGQALMQEGYGEASRAIYAATRPLYEEVRTRRAASTTIG